MGIDYVWFIIIGLGFDIIGAILIIKPILARMKRPPGTDDSVKFTKLQDENYYTKIRRLGIAGLICLVIGFILQIIGNYLQYLLSIS